MAIFDVSLSLRNGMLTFPGDPVFSIEPVFSRSNGDEFNLSTLSLTSHTGTHIDAPAHYFDGGDTIDLVTPDTFIGRGIVVDVRGVRVIDREILEESVPANETRIFFKTDNGQLLQKSGFCDHYTYLTDSAAELLVERGVRLVGIDYLSIDRYDDQYAPVHKLLLSAGVLIVEGLDLSVVPAGFYRIYCLPLKIKDGDAAPARVFIETISD
ncbi:MAG: cyclase family protein [Desulfomonilaceae bacterium]